MKIAVLMAALVASCFGAVEHRVHISGNLRCSHIFHYRITLWELDKSNHDLLMNTKVNWRLLPSGSYQSLTRNLASSGTATYSICVRPYDGWFEKEVEPAIAIEHSCGSKTGCFCKKFSGIKADFEMNLNIDLDKPSTEECGLCADAISRLEAR